MTKERQRSRTDHDWILPKVSKEHVFYIHFPSNVVFETSESLVLFGIVLYILAMREKLSVSVLLNVLMMRIAALANQQIYYKVISMFSISALMWLCKNKCIIIKDKTYFSAISSL